MSTMQRLTLIGLYNYEQQLERDLFSSLSLPAGYDKPTFINSLLLEHGEKCVLYTNPEFFKSAIGIWSGKWQMELKRIYEALTAEYNPIYNYDRYEESIDGRNKKYDSETHASGQNTNISSSGSERSEDARADHIAKDNPDYEDKQTNDYDVTRSQTVAGSIEHEVSADNSSTYQPDWKETTNVGTTKEENDGYIKHEIKGTTQDLEEISTNKVNGQESSRIENAAQDSSDTKTADSEHESNEHKAHLFGNIGVTTSAAMVSEVVQQRINMNLYDIATRLFANELLIGIY